MSDRKPVSPRTPAILEDPARNRGVAFSVREREELGLAGRLPSAVLTLGGQAERAWAQLRSLPNDLAKRARNVKRIERQNAAWIGGIPARHAIAVRHGERALLVSVADEPSCSL